LDEFVALLAIALAARGVRVERGEHFDLTARALGARGFLKVAWVDEGLEVRAKIKGGLFSSPSGLERLLLEAGREAQAKLTYEKEGAA
jgi:hypothetical protein